MSVLHNTDISRYPIWALIEQLPGGDTSLCQCYKHLLFLNDLINYVNASSIAIPSTICQCLMQLHAYQGGVLDWGDAQ